MNNYTIDAARRCWATAGTTEGIVPRRNKNEEEADKNIDIKNSHQIEAHNRA